MQIHLKSGPRKSNFHRFNNKNFRRKISKKRIYKLIEKSGPRKSDFYEFNNDDVRKVLKTLKKKKEKKLD